MNILSATDVMPSASLAVLTTTIKPKVNQNVIRAIMNYGQNTYVYTCSLINYNSYVDGGNECT